MDAGVKALKDRLDNSWLFRKNILNTSKKNFMKKQARNHSDVDPELTDFQQRFLKHWNNIEFLPEVEKDLESSDEPEKTKEELKIKFCENIINSESYDKGYTYAKSTVNLWRNKLPKGFKKKK